jgi:hypothetical protein
VEQVYAKGYDSGKFDGIAEGYIEGMNIGEDAAKQAFWDAYQLYGSRSDYKLAFSGTGWTNELFYPRYDMHITGGYQMFAYCPFEGSLKKRLENCGVQMTFSGGGSFMNLFGYAEKITELGVIDLSELTNTSNTHIFNQCKALQTIEKLILPPGQATWGAWFSGCAALESVIFEGVIESSGLDLSGSPKLDRVSMLSILNALPNKTGASGTWKVILGATNLAKLSASDKAIATGKGWTLA